MKQETLDTDGEEDPYVGETCIGFTIRSDFAHFRKVGNNSAKPTYRVPPRTTIAGLVAGILGMDRDSYYQMFQPSNSSVAVVPLNNPHTMPLSMTTVNTKSDEAIKYIPEDVNWQHGVEALSPQSYVELDRQRDPYEMLIDPEYRIYLSLRDDEVHKEIRERLDNSRYHYSPSLGLSECLASISEVESHSPEQVSSDTVEVDSAVHTVDGSVSVPSQGTTLRRERQPLYMESTEGGGRRTTEFANVSYVLEEDEKARIKNHAAYEVGEHTVSFS